MEKRWRGRWRRRDSRPEFSLPFSGVSEFKLIRKPSVEHFLDERFVAVESTHEP